MKSTRARWLAMAAGSQPGARHALLLPLLCGGILLLGGCASPGRDAPVAQNAVVTAPAAPVKSDVGTVSAALGSRLDQMLSQQVALSTH